MKNRESRTERTPEYHLESIARYFLCAGSSGFCQVKKELIRGQINSMASGYSRNHASLSEDFGVAWVKESTSIVFLPRAAIAIALGLTVIGFVLSSGTLNVLMQEL